MFSSSPAPGSTFEQVHAATDTPPPSPTGFAQSLQSEALQSRNLSDVTSEQIEEAVGAGPTAGSINSRRSTGPDGVNSKNQPETETYCFNERRGTWESGHEPFGTLIRNAGMVAEARSEVTKKNFYNTVKGIGKYDEQFVDDARYCDGLRFMSRAEFANQQDILDDCVFPCEDGLFNLISWEKETYADAARRGAMITVKDQWLKSPTFSRQALMDSEEYKLVLQWWKEYLPEELLCEEVSMRLSTGVMRMGCDTFKAFLNLHGFGHNGKSAFMKLINEAVGDVWRGTLDVQFLQPQPNDDPSKATSSMVAIQGKRFSDSSEPKTKARSGQKMQKKTLNGDLSRQLAGGDPLQFRNMYDSGSSTPARPNTVFFVVCSNESVMVVPEEKRAQETWAQYLCPMTFLSAGEMAKVRAGQKLTTYVDKRYMTTIKKKSPTDMIRDASLESRARFRLSVLLLMTEWYKYHACRKHVDEMVAKALEEGMFPGCIDFDDLRSKTSDPVVAMALSEGDWLPDSDWEFVNQFKSSFDPRWAVPAKTPASILRLVDWKAMRSEFATASNVTSEEEIQTPDEMFWRIFESTEYQTDVLPKGGQPPAEAAYGTKQHCGGMLWHFNNSDHNTPTKFELGEKEFAQLVKKYCVEKGQMPTEERPLRQKKTKSILLIEYIKLRPTRVEEEFDAMQEVEDDAPADRADRRAAFEQSFAADDTDAYYYARCEELMTDDRLCGDDGALLDRSQLSLIDKTLDKLICSSLQMGTGSSAQVSLNRLVYLIYDSLPANECALPFSAFFKGWLQLHTGLPYMRRTPTQEFKEWVARSVARAYASSLKAFLEKLEGFTVENGVAGMVVKGVFERSPRVVRQRSTMAEASSSTGVTAQQLHEEEGEQTIEKDMAADSDSS